MRSTKGEIRPGQISAASAKFGIVLGALFLIFGLVFFAVVFPGISEPELKILVPAFFLVFSGGCIAIMVVNWRMLKAGEKSSDNSLLEFRFEPDSPDKEPGDFAERLRKLDGLKKDGLITEAEYRSKREGILREKW